MNLLIVEDEAKAAGFLMQGLTEAGYTVTHAANGEDGLAFALSTRFDLILLDVMLPELDGWQVLRRLRANGVRTPVLMLTARDAVAERVRGFEMGADDYLVKPFAFAELLARARSLMRRMGPTPEGSLRIADLEIEPIRHRASRAGQRLELTSKEFLLLTLLMRHAGQPLTRAQIAEAVWEMPADSNVVEVNVRRLRSKVDDPFSLRLIHTVRGTGYVLEAR